MKNLLIGSNLWNGKKVLLKPSSNSGRSANRPEKLLKRLISISFIYPMVLSY